MSEKVRIRFSKRDDARFLSHHDLIRAFERMLRRAALPFRSTEGFHPKPKMAFASALGLGIVGHEEVVEIEFSEVLAPDEVRGRLSAQSLPGLAIRSVTPVAKKTVAQPARATYWLGLTSPPLDAIVRARAVEGLADRVTQTLAAAELWVERARPQKKRLNLRPYLENLLLQTEGLSMTLAITPQGAARPEEVLTLLCVDEVLSEGGVLERTRLELIDEHPIHAAMAPSAAAHDPVSDHSAEYARFPA